MQAQHALRICMLERRDPRNQILGLFFPHSIPRNLTCVFECSIRHVSSEQLSNHCQTRLEKGFMVMCNFLCRYLICKMLFHVLYEEKRMHYENDQFSSLTLLNEMKRSTWWGRKSFYGLKTEAYDCPEHQNAVMQEKVNYTHTCYILIYEIRTW